MSATTEAVGTDHPITEEELTEARRYTMVVQWSPADNLFIVTVPELGNAKTHGATPAEAIAMGAELAATVVSAHRALNEPVPLPRFFGS